MKAGLAFVAIVAIMAGVGAQTFSSGGTCVAKADAAVWKSAQDGCAAAFAKACVNTCSATSVDGLMAEWYDAMCTTADAIATVRVKAFAACITKGFTFGCAAAKAYADAQSSAIIALFSQSFASAINNCPSCDPLAANAVASIMSALVVKLDAKVAATAQAAVCVGPGGYAVADAYLKCTSQIYAWGLATACAQAWVSGGCTAMSGDIKANAIATVNNYIAVTDRFCLCKGYVKVAGVYSPVKWTAQELDTYYSPYNSCPSFKAKLVAQCSQSATQVV